MFRGQQCPRQGCSSAVTVGTLPPTLEVMRRAQPAMKCKGSGAKTISKCSGKPDSDHRPQPGRGPERR